MKRCTACRVPKSVEKFRNGRGECKACERSAKLLKRYGITVREYNSLVKRQGGVCAICRQPDKRGLCVDHDHITGDVRGALCHQCNQAIGKMRDNRRTLHRAIRYLRGTLT